MDIKIIVFLSRVFSSNRLNVFISIRRDEINRLLKKLSTYSRQELPKMELKTLFLEFTSNIMLRMVAGKRDYGDRVEDEEEARRFRETAKDALRIQEISCLY